MRLEPFSSWPKAWDPEVQRVLQRARDLGIPSLRIKVKFGTLRIQEGGEGLQPAVEEADRATQVICPVCGGERARQQGATLQYCDRCLPDRDAGGKIEWIEQIHSEASGPRSHSLLDVGDFPFPTYFTVVSHYGATGEGITVSVLMSFAHDADDLRQQVADHIEPYFASKAEYFPQLMALGDTEDLIPPRVKSFIHAPDSIDCDFSYFGRFHLNQA